MGDSEPGQSTPLKTRARPAPPLLRVDVVRRSRLWREENLSDAAVIAAARAAVGEALPADDGPGELAVVLTDDAEVRALNRKWRGKDAATNVLSFPLGAPVNAAGPRAYGDVVLAFETVAREAGGAHGALADHASHLVVHGVLHLLGFDHENDAEAQRMEALESRILAGLGIADPHIRVNGRNS